MQVTKFTAHFDDVLDFLHQGELDDLDLVPGIIKCLSSVDDAAQAAAAAAIAILGQKSAFRTRLQADGRFVSAAISLIGSPAQDVRQNIFRALRSVAEDKAIASELCALGALGKLAASTNTFAAVAYKQLLNQHLPAKYGYYGLLELGDTVQIVQLLMPSRFPFTLVLGFPVFLP